MADHQQIFDQLCDHVRETAKLENINALLGWDERVMLPERGGAYRADQVTLLAGIIHDRNTDPQLGAWLEELTDSPLTEEPNSFTEATIRRIRSDYLKQVKLPKRLIEEFSHSRIIGQQTWVKARADNNFGTFEPILDKLISLSREMAEAIGYEGEQYDALLDFYEPEAKTAQVRQVLETLKSQLVPLVAEIKDSGRQPNLEILKRNFPIAAQEQFGKVAAAKIGFDFTSGRLDVTHHPFCSTSGPHDCRITTRYDEDFFPSAFFSILHEAGHGIYEQGLPEEWFGLPPGAAASLGVHESQSRLWENIVGRSYAFWSHFYPEVKKAFPAALGDVPMSDFHFAINEVTPSLIRVEADEATYNLHIIIRFELEQALLSGDLQVKDLPGAWNEKYTQQLGITPPNDADGCLQDVHWSAGLMGYFPTYSLGNIYSAQLMEQAHEDLGDLEGMFAAGEFAPLLGWLRENVHQAGQCYPGDKLVERVCGDPIDSAPLIRYLRAKLGPLYGIEH
ncbi:carboxypeptidase M32 [Bremerella cremea]|uniref:Metal-dependent carboxypeptidase n=1 Tax=Blastopirellula marina TaxID=124 RepID=A0A2S8G5M1_9BACT|nr:MULTISPECIES: carboxypeptidase M32 [Pirellulaceae]PQO39752.1 carboxypeptidase M32 [Blastopirellula marina]RCS51219.1 carboxypeptidase M32 [Bremerella cremea]